MTQIELDNLALFDSLKSKYNLKEIVFAGQNYLQFSKEFPFNLIHTTINPSIITLFSHSLFNGLILSFDESCSIYNTGKINMTIHNSIQLISQYILLEKQMKLQKKFQDIGNDF